MIVHGSRFVVDEIELWLHRCFGVRGDVCPDLDSLRARLETRAPRAVIVDRRLAEGPSPPLLPLVDAYAETCFIVLDEACDASVAAMWRARGICACESTAALEGLLTELFGIEDAVCRNSASNESDGSDVKIHS